MPWIFDIRKGTRATIHGLGGGYVVGSGVNKDLLLTLNPSVIHTASFIMKKPDVQPKAAKRRLIFSLILLIGGVAYAIFPLDFIPDILGPIGWCDDIGLLLATFLNAAYSYRKAKKGAVEDKGSKK